MNTKLVFLKLGGSLITVKDQPHTPRLDVMERLAQEIAAARSADPGLRILLGHGSGSYGHVPASQFHTRQGVKTPQEWYGFVEVWRQAAELNHLVMDAMEKAGLPAIAFPPSAAVTACEGKVVAWNLEPLQGALMNQLLPVIYGDVVFDQALGGTILSTEDLFAYLVLTVTPPGCCLRGWSLACGAIIPANTHLLPEITPYSFTQVEMGLQGSVATDVTGGMLDKVRQVLSMVSAGARVERTIFSGEMPGNNLLRRCSEKSWVQCSMLTDESPSRSRRVIIWFG